MEVRGALEKIVSAAYAPLVLVQSSDGAEAAARRNGLTVADLLRPFAALGQTVPLRTGNKSFSLTDFTVRLLPATELSAASVDSVDPYLQRGVASHVAAAPVATLTSSSIASQEDAERLLAGKGLPTSSSGKDKDPSPWYTSYRRGLHSHFRCLPTEQRDCPILTLIVISTMDPSPISAAYELASSSALPKPFQVDLFDPDVHKCFILLHDQSSLAQAVAAGRAAPQDPMAIYRELRQHFQVPCYLLPFNSAGAPGIGSAATPPPQDIWAPHMLEPLFPATLARASAPPQGAASSAAGSSSSNTAGGSAESTSSTTAAAPSAAGASGSSSGPGSSAYARALLAQAAAPARGCCLTPEDVNALRATMTKVLTEGVAKALESRYVGLTNAIAANRRSGLGGIVRSWLRPASGSSRDVLEGVRGTANAPGALAGQGSPAPSSSSSVAGAANSATPAGGSSGSDGGGSGSGGGDGGSDLTTVSLPYGSLESQLRQLGDLCMAMGDYDAAATHYKRLRDELKPERSPGYSAAAAEGAGLASFLAAGPSREVDQLLDTAVTLYFRTAAAAAAGGVSATTPSAPPTSSYGGPSDGSGLPSLPPLPPAGTPAGMAVLTRRLGVRLASRAAGFAADAMLASSLVALASAGVTASTSPSALASGGPAVANAVAFASSRLRDASSLLRRVAQAEGDGSLASALLTEQAGMLLLRTLPLAHLRKAAYHFATAGNLFGQAGVPGLAVRCLSLGLSAYAPSDGASSGGGSWSYVEDALVAALAQRLGAVGDPGAACDNLARLLSRSGGRLAQNTQRNLLAQLLRSYASWASAKEGAAVAAAASKKRAKAPAGTDAALTDAERKTAVAEGAASATLISAGLPIVEDASFHVASFSNAWAAALAVHSASNPGAAAAASGGSPPPTAAAGATSGAAPSSDSMARGLCAGVLERLGLQPSIPLTGPAAAAGAGLLSSLPTSSSSTSVVDAFARLLAEAGCAAEGAAGGVGGKDKGGPLHSSALFTGHLPGEGPPPPRLQALAGSAWSRIQEQQVARELRSREKLRAALAQAASAAASGNGIVSTSSSPSPPPPSVAAGGQPQTSPVGSPSGTAAAFTASPAASAPRYDWRAVCHDLAVLLEDEAEQHGRELSQANTTSAAGAGCLRPAPAPGQQLSQSLSLGLLGLDTDGDVNVDASVAADVFTATLGDASASASSSSLAGATAPMKTHPPASLSAPAERYVGEPLAVTVTLRNPLAMELPVLGITIEHAWMGSSGDADDSASAGCAAVWIAPHPSSDDGRGGRVSAAEVVRRGAACLPVDILLQPGESRTVRLMLRPLRKGTLLLKGVSWAIAGLVRCAHELTLKGPPLNDSRNNRAAGARAIDRRLETTIAPGREWLGVRLAGLAGSSASSKSIGSSAAVSLLDGERRTCELVVTNHGCSPAGGSLLMRWEGKGHVFAAVHAGSAYSNSSSKSAVNGVESEGSSSGGVVALDGIDGALTRLELTEAVEVRDETGQAVKALPTAADVTSSSSSSTEGDGNGAPVAILPAGWSAVWRVSLRARGPGRHTTRAMLWYGPPAAPLAAPRSYAAGSTALRCVRLTFRAVVRPALVTSVLVEPSLTSAGDYTMTVTATHVAQAPGLLTSAAASGPVGLQVPHPIAVSGIHVVSDHWQAQLTSASTYQPDGSASSSDGSGSSIVSKSWPLGPPLGYKETRVLVYTLTRRGAPLAPGPDGTWPKPKSRPALRTGGLSDPQTVLLRLQRAHCMVSQAVAAGQLKERVARAAAAAQDALPPTLRSIAQERAAAEAAAARQAEEEELQDEEEQAGILPPAGSPSAGGDGGPGSANSEASQKGKGAVAAPSSQAALTAALRSFPASLDALRGGAGKVHVVLSWSQWSRLDAAMSDGAVAQQADGGVAYVEGSSNSTSQHQVVGEAYHQDLPTLCGRYLSLSTDAGNCQVALPLSSSSSGTDVGACTFLGPSPALLPVTPPMTPATPTSSSLGGEDVEEARTAAVAAASCYLASVAPDPSAPGAGRIVTVYRAPPPPHQHHHHHHHHGAAASAAVRFASPSSAPTLIGVDATAPVSVPVTGVLTVRQALWPPAATPDEAAAAVHPPLAVVPCL